MELCFTKNCLASDVPKAVDHDIGSALNKFCPNKLYKVICKEENPDSGVFRLKRVLNVFESRVLCNVT